MNESPIQVNDLGGKWFAKGSQFVCNDCGKEGRTGANILLLETERLICGNCVSSREQDE